MRVALITFAFLMAACGAEAPPRHSETAPSGVSISGEARIGVRTEL